MTGLSHTLHVYSISFLLENVGVNFIHIKYENNGDRVNYIFHSENPLQILTCNLIYVYKTWPKLSELVIFGKLVKIVRCIVLIIY